MTSRITLSPPITPPLSTIPNPAVLPDNSISTLSSTKPLQQNAQIYLFPPSKHIQEDHSAQLQSNMTLPSEEKLLEILQKKEPGLKNVSILSGPTETILFFDYNGKLALLDIVWGDIGEEISGVSLLAEYRTGLRLQNAEIGHFMDILA